MTRVEELGEKIRAEVRAGLAEGWKLTPAYLRHERRDGVHACALGMCVRDVPYNNVSLLNAVEERLGLSAHEYSQFYTGFDMGLRHTELAALGDDIAREFGVVRH